MIDAAEMQRVAGQQARIDIRLLDAGELERLRDEPQRFGNRSAVLQSGDDPHCAPSAANNSA